MHIYDVPKSDLLARYADVLKPSSLPSVDVLRAQVLAQHSGDACLQAVGLLLVEKYAGICSLGNDCAGAFMFESETLEELDRFADAVRQAEALAAAVLTELLSAGFKLGAHPSSGGP